MGIHLQLIRSRRRRKSSIPILTICFSLALLFLPKDAATRDPINIEPLFPVAISHEFEQPELTFKEVKNLILKHYYSGEINEESLYWAAIKGMLRQISPPKQPNLSTLWTEEAYQEIFASLSGEQVSIGIKSIFNSQTGSLTVTEILPGSPADAILQTQDRILRIDGKPLKGENLGTVNRLISGKEGEEITLTVNRDIQVFDVTLKCKKFERQNLIMTRLTDTIAMLQIRQFTGGMADDIKGRLEELEKEKMQRLIIDLRNNPGGVFIEALKTAELFLPKDSILLRTVVREKGLQNYVSVNGHPYHFDIAVLANDNTASSSEILVAALQDHQKGLIIGTRTFGKGIFEKTFTLDNQMRVKFITGAMYSPRGRTWHGKGITPDFLVQQDDKTLAALMEMAPRKRATVDPAIITAQKLLSR